MQAVWNGSFQYTGHTTKVREETNLSQSLFLKKRLLLIPANASINMTYNFRKQSRFLEQVTNKPKTLQKISDNISNEIVIIIPQHSEKLSFLFLLYCTIYSK